MGQADALLLSRYRHWRVFGGGSWSSPVVPNRAHQLKVLHGFLYQVARLAQIPFRRLVWATRFELGETTQREHYHWLIGSQDWLPSLSNMFQLNELWDSFPAAGFSRNFRYDQRLNGIEYVSWCLSETASGRGLGADFYESSKFSFELCDVTFSNSFAFAVGGKRVCVEKHARL